MNHIKNFKDYIFEGEDILNKYNTDEDKEDIKDIIDLFQPYADEFFIKRKFAAGPEHLSRRDNLNYQNEEDGGEDFYVLFGTGGAYIIEIYLNNTTESSSGYTYNRLVSDFSLGPLKEFTKRMEDIGYTIETKKYADYIVVYIKA